MSQFANDHADYVRNRILLPLAVGLKANKSCVVTIEELASYLQLPPTQTMPSYMPSAPALGPYPTGSLGGGMAGTGAVVNGTTSVDKRKKKVEGPVCSYMIKKRDGTEAICGKVAVDGTDRCAACSKKGQTKVKGKGKDENGTGEVKTPAIPNLPEGNGLQVQVPVAPVQEEGPDMTAYATTDGKGRFKKYGYVITILSDGRQIVSETQPDESDNGSRRPLTPAEIKHVTEVLKVPYMNPVDLAVLLAPKVAPVPMMPLSSTPVLAALPAQATLMSSIVAK